VRISNLIWTKYTDCSSNHKDETNAANIAFPTSVRANGVPEKKKSYWCDSQVHHIRSMYHLSKHANFTSPSSIIQSTERGSQLPASWNGFELSLTPPLLHVFMQRKQQNQCVFSKYKNGAANWTDIQVKLNSS